MLGIDFKMSSQPFFSHSDVKDSDVNCVTCITVTAWLEVPLAFSLFGIQKELYIKAESLRLENRGFSAHMVTVLMLWSLML